MGRNVGNSRGKSLRRGDVRPLNYTNCKSETRILRQSLLFAEVIESGVREGKFGISADIPVVRHYLLSDTNLIINMWERNEQIEKKNRENDFLQLYKSFGCLHSFISSFYLH